MDWFKEKILYLTLNKRHLEYFNFNIKTDIKHIFWHSSVNCN